MSCNSEGSTHAPPTGIVLGETPLTLSSIVQAARHGASVRLGARARERMQASRRLVETLAAAKDGAQLVYGVNTGFGALAEVRISHEQIEALQHNLVRSHAAGVGAPLPEDAVRAMMLLRAAVLSNGHAGVRPQLGELLCELINRRVHPVIPSRGSVGASGDLAPLAHLALVLIGEGEAFVHGARMPGAQALAQVGLSPLTLSAKEGLSLLNGTQLMTAVGALATHDAIETCELADLAGAMTLEAYRGTPRAFAARIQDARPHPGQRASAEHLRRLLVGSQIVESHKHCGRVQDPYSLRCMPQVHGATRDALAYARTVLECEANSTTDNPLVFADDQEIISGGNFHGQPVALAMDFAAIAVAELANISERRIEQLVNPHLSSDLPAFLASDSGLNSGFMMAQVTAAALVSENKVLCHPASVDSIPSSAGREDHVSMGAHAALKFAQVHENVRTVLAVEFLCAAQGLDFRAPLVPGAALAAAHRALRAEVPPLVRDRVLSSDIASVRRLLDDGSVLAAARGALG